MIRRALIASLLLLLLPLMQGCDETPKKVYAADFTLKLFNGQTFTLSKHKGEAVVVNFSRHGASPAGPRRQPWRLYIWNIYKKR